MRFKLADTAELDRAADYLAKLAGREAVVDITKVQYDDIRTLAENRYYYLLINYWATQYGCDKETAKTILKASQPGIYKPVDVRVTDNITVTKYRSSKDLTTKEMADSITKYKDWSASIGIDLPDAENESFMKWAADTVANSGAYL